MLQMCLCDACLQHAQHPVQQLPLCHAHAKTQPCYAAAPATCATGEYTAERLAALQASTAQLPSKYKPAQPAATATAARPGDGSFKLSGSFKALKKPNDDRFSYGYSIHGTVANTPAGAGVNGAAAGGAGLLQQLEQEHQQPEQMPLPPPPKRPGGGGTAAAAAGSGSGSDRDDEGFALPDEETIRWVRSFAWPAQLMKVLRALSFCTYCH